MLVRVHSFRAKPAALPFFLIRALVFICPPQPSAAPGRSALVLTPRSCTVVPIRCCCSGRNFMFRTTSTLELKQSNILMCLHQVICRQNEVCMLVRVAKPAALSFFLNRALVFICPPQPSAAPGRSALVLTPRSCTVVPIRSCCSGRKFMFRTTSNPVRS